MPHSATKSFCSVRAVALAALLPGLFFCSRGFPGDESATSLIGLMSQTAGTPYFAGVETAQPSGNAGVRLSWSKAIDNQTAQDNLVYDIYQATSSGAQDFETPSVSSTAGATSATLTGLTVGQTYYFVVRARDTDGKRDSNKIERSATPMTIDYFTGIRNNQSIAAMTGWSVCHTSVYNASETLANIQAACSRDNLLLGCRLVAAPDNLIVAAHGPRSTVLQDVGSGVTASVDANSVSWYYNASSSWGFFEPGDGVSRGTCDTATGTFPQNRLCWHTANDVNGGYRCGATINLNTSALYERVILHAY